MGETARGGSPGARIPRRRRARPCGSPPTCRPRPHPAPSAAAVGDENAEERGRGDGPSAVRAAFAEGALRLGKAGGTLCAVSA